MILVKKVLIGVLLVFLGLFVCVVIFRFAITKYTGFTNNISNRNGIEKQEYVMINGYKQWIVIRGEDMSNPVILYLHGGPGSPESGMAIKDYQGELEKHFVVVHWEQRGTCKSYSSDIERGSISFDDYLSDVDEMTKYLLSTLKKSKIYLIGHSWGSRLGIETVSRHPELYFGYIGVGQEVNTIEQERLSYSFTLDYLTKYGTDKEINELRSIGIPPYQNIKNDISVERKYLTKAGGVFGPQYPLPKLIWDVLRCPYYSWIDFYRFYKGSVYSLNNDLKESYWKVEFDKTNTKFKIPVYFIMGENDFNTPLAAVQAYYSNIQAPEKELVVFKGTSHMLPFEEPKKFNSDVIRLFHK